VEYEGVITVSGRRRAERCAATKPTVVVVVPCLTEDLLLEFVLFLFVVRLFLRFQPPELIRERKIGEDEREFVYCAIGLERRVRDRAAPGFDLRLKAVEDGVNLSDRGVTPIHFLREVLRAGRVIAFFAKIIGAMDEHSAASAGRIVNRVTRLWFENPNERVHDFRWS